MGAEFFNAVSHDGSTFPPARSACRPGDRHAVTRQVISASPCEPTLSRLDGDGIRVPSVYTPHQQAQAGGTRAATASASWCAASSRTADRLPALLDRLRSLGVPNSTARSDSAATARR
ncbi:MAG: hypothetical protein U0797_02730 [Gemmataceae bacterium]